MACFFPIPYPDELLYSILARYHVRSGNVSPKATLKELFGLGTLVAVVDMPCYIERLIERFSSFIKYNAEELILRHTLYPYYTAFLSKERSSGILQSMRGEFGGEIHAKTGIMASGIHTRAFLMFCPECFRRDIDKYGEPYWHRLHQIPGVLVCTEHCCLLQESRIRIHAENRHELIPAMEDNCLPMHMPNALDDGDFQKLIWIAGDTQYLLEYSEIVRKTVGDPEVIRKKYLALLKEKELATCNGRVYQSKLLRDFSVFYDDKFLRMMQSEIDPLNQNNWLASITRKQRKAFHPIRNLLFIRFLSGDIEKFIFSNFEYLPFGKGPWPCLNITSAHYHKAIVRKISITHCGDTKLPVGTFKCSCGFTYSRRGPDMTDNDRYKIGRIKEFGPVWKRRLKELSADGTISLREMARMMSVDTNTVKLQLSRLDIAVKAKKTDKLKRQRSMYSPKKYRTPICQDRIDWIQRDAEVLESTETAVQQILSSKGKPIRLSISRIGKITGKLSLLERHLDKMPQTKAHLDAVVESDVVFRKRRIDWAIRQLCVEGTEPKPWRVKRLAGIRPEYLKETENYIIWGIENSFMN